MRPLLIVLCVILCALAVLSGAAWWRYSQLFDTPSVETVQMTAQKREMLTRLRKEEKFEPHNYLPLGYTGVATHDEGVTARGAVNDVLDSILSRKDGPVSASLVSGLIGAGMKRVHLLETEDRERTGNYMVEIWYLLGFKGSTGRFAYGSAFPKPEGYGEPLPPGWKSPTQPRPIS